MKKQGMLIVISGFSGVGKGTAVKELVKKPGYSLSISATTRSPREGETHGKEYYFKTVEEFEKLKQIIADVLSVDPEEVKMETTFMDDLGADSLDVYQIIMGIEEEFDIEVSEELAENIKTVEEAVELIKNAMN